MRIECCTMALRIQDYCVGNYAVVVAVFIFSKHNGLCGRLADSNFFYTRTNTVHKFLCMHNVICVHIICTPVTIHAICEDLISDYAKKQMVLDISSAWSLYIALDISSATWAVAFDISTFFERVCHVNFLHIRKSCGMWGQIFGLILSFLSNRQLQVVLMGGLLKNIQLMLSSSRLHSWSYIFFYYSLMAFSMKLSVIFLSTC